MYVKNCVLYFNKNDYLHLKKFKFSILGRATHRITDGKHYDYAMNRVSLHADYGMHMDFCPTSKSSDEIKVSITKDKRIEKMSVLYNLKKVMTLIYDALLLCKQYVHILNCVDDLIISIILTHNEFCKNVNLIRLYHNSMILFINPNGHITKSNTIIAVQPHNVDKIPRDKIIIENNFMYTARELIIYPESHNIYYNKTTPYSIHFKYDNEALIIKYGEDCYINHFVPITLLIKFIDNIELFNGPDEVYINNECDMLKYI